MAGKVSADTNHVVEDGHTEVAAIDVKAVVVGIDVGRIVGNGIAAVGVFVVAYAAAVDRGKYSDVR